MLYYVITHLFCTLSLQSNTYLFTYLFIFYIFPVLSIGSSSRWLFCSFDISVTMFLFFHNTSLALALQNAAGSSCIFPAPDLESDSFFPGDLILCLDNSIRNQDLGAWCMTDIKKNIPLEYFIVSQI